MHLLLSSLTYSLAICGLYFAGSEGGLFHFLHKPFVWAEKKIIDAKHKAMIHQGALFIWPYQIILFFYKPFVACPKCMASIWGTVLYCSLNEFEIKEYLLTIFIISCMNNVIQAAYYKLES